MPWSKIEEAPANIRKLNGTALSLSQVNWIARVADGIPKGQVDNTWAVAIAQFKRAHTVKDGKWVKKGGDEKKEHYASLDFNAMALEDGDAVSIIEKNDHGTYNIMTVSTAALPDREEETFTTKAMDYDIMEAERTGEFPEYRVFHSKHLGIGKVTKMRRVGIFAVDEGESYDDPFSLAVCEKMLADNDGRWRVSRGFRVYELEGGCPMCNSALSISTKHMLAGYRCPGCDQVYLRFKGVLSGIQFKKARTFDITITDVPAVPYTGAFAWKNGDENRLGDIFMNKKELKQRLLKAGIDEEMVDARLKELTEEQLAEFDDIPDATLLKEFSNEDDAPAGDDTPADTSGDDMEVGYDQLLTAIKEIVEEVIDGLHVEVDDLDIELKEFDGIAALEERMKSIEDKLDQMLVDEEARMKELLNGSSRNTKRIIRMKGMSKKTDAEDDMEDDGDEEDEDKAKRLGVSKETLAWIKHAGPKPVAGDRIMDSEGKEYTSMTEMLQSNMSE